MKKVHWIILASVWAVGLPLSYAFTPGFLGGLIFGSCISITVIVVLESNSSRTGGGGP